MEREPVGVAGKVLGLDELLEAVGVAVGLRLDLAQGVALALGLDGADDLLFGDEQVVHRACRGHELPDGDAGTGREVRLAVIHDDPAGGRQHLVDA